MTQSITTDNLGIAIIGMAGRFPGANDVEQFWQNLHDGVESIRRLSDEELRTLGATDLDDPRLVKAAAILDDLENFDAAFFGYTPTEARLLDPQQRVFLETAWQALENAGYEADSFDGNIGVYAGSTISTYLLYNLMQNPTFARQVDPVQLHISNAGDFLTTRVSYKLNLKGPSHLVSSACSTSLVAIHLASQSLLNEECDMALAGGISINVRQRTGYRYIEGAMESPDGHCRTFDARAEGTLFGCGTGIVVLKRLEDALADGDTILAVIRGSALNNDGSLKVGFTAPSVIGQSEVIKDALDVAGIEADTISYIEAHGTGTALGDPIEIQALTKAFRSSTQRGQFCGIGSVKTNLGHLEAAAGVTSLIKTVLSLGHRQLPPSLHFEQPNPQIDFANSPFYVVDRLQDWPEGPTPRRAGISSFGFGGTNAHMIVEEAPAPLAASPELPWQLLTLSARTATALDKATANLLSHLKQHPEQSLSDVAYTLQVGRKAFGQRRMLVCHNQADAIERLEKSQFATSRPESTERGVVFMFPGQGSQYPGMAEEFYRHVPFFREQLDRCCQLLQPYLGFDLREVLYPEPDQLETARLRLEQTALTQPALFVVEYALARLWQKWGVVPQAMVGHSIGEYVAATLAGVFSLEDALKLVALRGQLMQAQPAGAMLAVSLPESELLPWLKLDNDLSLAAVNGSQQCVVAGPEEAIVRLARQLAEEDMVVSRLHTSHAFHSAMMQPVVEQFRAEVARLRLHAPKIPYLSNLTGQWITPAQATDPGYWANHLRQTVRFSDNLAMLGQTPEQVLLEVGPGQTLGKLSRRHPAINSKQVVLASLPASLSGSAKTFDNLPSKSDLASWSWQMLGQLWLAGVKVHWRKVYAGQTRRRIPLPTYPFERQRYWVDPLPLTHSSQPDSAGLAESISASAQATKLPLEDWFYQPGWKMTPLPSPTYPLSTLPTTGWLIFMDDYGLGLALAEKLLQAGQFVRMVRRGTTFDRIAENVFSLRPDYSDDYHQLWQRLDLDTPEQPWHILHLWSWRNSLDEAKVSDHFRNLLGLIQSVNRIESGQTRLEIFTSNLVDVSGADDLAVEQSPLLALAQIATQENPRLACRLIDLAGDANPAELATRIWAELQTAPRERLVAYRGRRRWLPAYEPLNPPATVVPLNGVYLITEGLTNVGWGLTEQLATHGAARLVITGRETDQARLDWLHQLGAQVVFVQTEATDPAGLKSAVAQALQVFGTLNGVIHAAPAALEIARRFEAVSETDPAQTAASFQAGLQTLVALETALPDDLTLEFCLILSSLAVQLGGKGYLIYAATHTLLDSYVARHNQSASRQLWRSVNLDAWQFLEQAGPQITDLNADLAQLAINSEEGYAVLQRLVAPELPEQIIVSTGRLDLRLSTALNLADPTQLGTNASATVMAQPELQPRPSLSNLYVPAETALEKQIVTIWQAALGFDQIGLYDNFFELGGESLAALQVISQLKKQLNVNLPTSSLYESLTVRALVDLIQAARQAIDPTKQAAQLEIRETKATRRKQFQEEQRLRRKG